MMSSHKTANVINAAPLAAEVESTNVVVLVHHLRYVNQLLLFAFYILFSTPHTHKHYSLFSPFLSPYVSLLMGTNPFVIFSRCKKGESEEKEEEKKVLIRKEEKERSIKYREKKK